MSNFLSQKQRQQQTDYMARNSVAISNNKADNKIKNTVPDYFISQKQKQQIEQNKDNIKNDSWYNYITSFFTK